MISKRFTLIVSLLLALSILLSACGGSYSRPRSVKTGAPAR
jgi:hypothetical protein